MINKTIFLKGKCFWDFLQIVVRLKKNLIDIHVFLVTQAVLDEQRNTSRRASAGGASTHPSRSFRYLQEQYNDDNSPTTTNQKITTSKNNIDLRRSSDIHIPSRTFKSSQDQHDASQQTPVNRSQAVNNRSDLLEIYNKRKINK